MTLYYTLVFFLLLTEMTIFMLLILPLPFTFRRKLFYFISTSPLIAKVQYGMKITFIFILILFLDSVNRVYRVTQELHSISRSGLPVGATLGPERMEVQARKFYSQRNMYLCGFTLFLSLILNRTYVLILDVLRLEETVHELQAQIEGKEGKGGKGDNSEVKKLQEKLAASERDKEVLKKQAEGLTREYGDLSDKYNKVEAKGRKEVRKDL